MTHQTNLRAAWLIAKGMLARRSAGTTGESVGVTESEPKNLSAAAKKKWRRKMPLRMTPKAQRRRWFREHNRRMKAIVLRKQRDEGGSSGGRDAPR
jgi:hypothetical protein